MSETQLSRRGFLALMGLGGAMAGSGLIGWALLAPRRDTSQIIYITATPPSTAAFRYPTMVSRGEWGAFPPDHNARNEGGFYSTQNPFGWRRYDEPLVEIYQTVVIHHSVIDEGNDIDTLLEIQRAHREDRGWADVGYHYFVGKEGMIYEGRDVRVRGTHVGGANTGSVGVCFLGNYVFAQPSDAQIRAATGLITWLAETLSLTHLAGHRHFNPETLCPGTNLLPHLGSLAATAGLEVGIEGYIPPTEQVGYCPYCSGIMI